MIYRYIMGSNLILNEYLESKIITIKNNILSYNIGLYYMEIKNLLVAQRTSFDTFVGVNAR